MEWTHARVTLLKAEEAILARPIVGNGGMQRLLRAVLSKRGSDQALVLSRVDIQNVRNYAARYGRGGFQDRLEALIAAIDRAITREEVFNP